MEPEAAVLPPELRAEIDAARAERLGRFGWERAAWLVLLPEWSVPLAQACGFPFGDELPEGFVDRAATAGLCERREEIGRRGRPELRFWVPSLQREELLEAVKAELGRRAVRDLAGEVAERLLELGDELQPSLRHWAELAAPEASGSGGAARLSDEVRRAGDQAEALDWIAAGEGLVPLVGGELEAAVSRGKRRVNLEYRRRADERLLSRYVERQDAEAELRRLAEGDDDEWALHLIGMGGVGKTMLVRYLVGRLAPELELAVARVDFDHIDPRFPWERPAELLVELADALAAHVTTPEQERALENFVERVRRADEARTHAIGAGLARLEAPEFVEVLTSFVRFLAQLHRPVVLVLDTCEELAKLHPAEGTVRSVDALFAILEALQRHPAIADERFRLRVLLAGRRLLATAGAGWSYDDSTRQPPALTSLAARSYLRLHEVRGFDRDEAASLYGRIDEELFAAILEASREAGRVPGVPGGSEGAGANRFNPFDLELYAQWLVEAPELRAADVAAGGTDAYVKARIVDRLHEPGVAALLPAAVLLRRFDLAMLAPVMPDDAGERARLMEALSEQEWVDLAAGETPDTMIVEVEPHLLPRLERWFEGGARRSVLAAARGMLGPHLARLLLERPLDALAVDCADAALRLLRGEAEGLWLALEERVAREGRWEWAAGTCERLLGYDEAGRPQHLLLRAAIGATHAAALLHRDGRVTSGAWEDVLADVEDMAPDSELRGWLALRARLGTIAAGSVPTWEWPGDFAPFLDVVMRVAGRRPFDQNVAAGIAALEAVADGKRLAAPPARGAFPIRPLLSWAEAVEQAVDGPELAAATWLVAARLLYRARHDEEALTAFERAERLASDCVDRPEQRWLDWLAPDSIVDRVRLEGVLAGLAGTRLEGRDDRALAWLSGAQQRIDRIDAERLASVWLLEILARRVPPLPLVRELAAPAREVPLERPRCAAHERVPPLFVAVARAWAAIGDADQALVLLDRRISEGEGRRGADVALARTVGLARVELLAVLRRLLAAGPELPGPEGRWHYVARRAVSEPSGPEELTEGLALAALSAGFRPPPAVTPVSAAELHARWRASAHLDRPLAQLIARELRGNPTAPVEDVIAPELRGGSSARDALKTHLALDLVEASAMGFEGLRAEVGSAAGLHELVAELRTADPEPVGYGDAIRLALRCRALFVAEPDLDEARPRRVAELALEEGELLALRLPRNACALLEDAHKRFVWAGDSVGGFCAAVAWAAAEHRAGNDDRARDVVSGRAREAYERLRVAGPRMPPWSALVAGRTADLGDSPLTPWVIRLAPLARWAEGGGKPPLRSGPEPPEARPPSPPVFNVGSQAAVAQQVAVDQQVTVAQQVAPPAPAAEPVMRRRRPWALVALGLSALAAVVALATMLTFSAAPTSSPGDSGGGATIALEEIALIVAALAFGVWALRRRTRAPSACGCSITRAAPGSAVVELTGYRELPFVGARSPRARQIPIPEADGREEVAGLLTYLAGEPVPARTRVAVIVDTALAPAPWERVLVGTDPVPSLWRTPSGRRAVRFRGGESSRRVTVRAPERWLLLVEEAWDPLPVDAGGSASVVHLIGAPAQTPGGWRLRIEAGTLEAPSSGTVTAASRERQALVDPREVSPYGGELVVVQGLPGVLDPAGAGGLRGFAAAVQAAGAYAVLTIPSLPPEAAQKAIAALAAELPERPPKLRDLLRLVAGLRGAIAREVPPEAASTALDAVLFAPSEKE